MIEDANQVDEADMTPLDIAFAFGNTEAAELIKKVLTERNQLTVKRINRKRRMSL